MTKTDQIITGVRERYGKELAEEVKDYIRQEQVPAESELMELAAGEDLLKAQALMPAVLAIEELHKKGISNREAGLFIAGLLD